MFLSIPDMSMVTSKANHVTKIQFTIFIITVIE